MMLEHAEPGKRESGEHPDRVQADERIELRLEHDDEQDGDRSEDEDAIGEREPVTALGQLTREERIPGHEAGEIRKTVEARVAAGEEDHHRRGLHHIEERGSDPRVAEDVLHLLGHDGRAAAEIRHRMCPVREQRCAQHEEPEDPAHDQQCDASVARFGTPEAGDAVRHRLEPGE